MPEIASLEHSNIMSKDMSDEFEPAAEPVQGQFIELPASPTSQEEPPAEVEQPATEPENALPPEAEGEANGGPLGCCLGVMIGLLLSLSLAIFSRVFIGPLGSLFQGNYGLLGLLTRILMGLLAFAFAIIFGYLGWRVGRRLYREYEPPIVKERKRKPRVKKIHSEA
jgi:hypothetical protein